MKGPSGRKRIDENQDALVVRDLGDGQLLLAVMDGISNSPAGGSVAKRAAMQLNACKPLEVALSGKEIISLIHRMSQEESFWGCTLTMAVVDIESGGGILAWIGDSPAFIVRADVTEKTEVLIRPHVVGPNGHLTSHFPLNSDLRIDTIEFQMYPGDVLVLVTDGVATSREASDIDDLCRAQPGEIDLIPERALSDDVTFVVARMCR